jgi:hypothetical protein
MLSQIHGPLWAWTCTWTRIDEVAAGSPSSLLESGSIYAELRYGGVLSATADHPAT